MNFFTNLLKIFVSVGLAFWLINETNINNILEFIVKLHWIDFVLIFLVLLLEIFVASLRWNGVLKILKIKISYIESLKLLWIGLFFSQVMPSSLGGDLFKGYYLKQKGYTMKNTTLAILLDRIFGLFAMILLVVLLLPLLFSIGLVPLARWSVISIIPLAIFALASLFLIERMPAFISNLKPMQYLIDFVTECRGLIFNKKTGFKLLLLSLFIHFLSIASIIVVSSSITDQVPFMGLILVMPLVIFLMAIPISIAGWGVREGIMVIGLGYVGVSSDLSLAISLVYGFSLLLVSLPGLALWLIRK